MYVGVYIYIYIYIHTHTYIYIYIYMLYVYNIELVTRLQAGTGSSCCLRNNKEFNGAK